MMLCAAAVGASRVLLLNEPGNGIDFGSRLRLEEMIRAWCREHLVLVPTHDDEFAAAVAARSISMQAPISGRDRSLPRAPDAPRSRPGSGSVRRR